ncbi:hypothetical protein MTF65_17840 [Streptomyces sp. APSN-46.1]|uniref:hypothetical protein n=1 Tax=Streptomyces sp. APSN-46.1 TaxID=2929049 RepID=UPI001FB545FA|nr:hypothetical protein [Streptomyces sp. APSN-46.1]MCJ1679168.1 hypothetical protein [Streptomyces sp. APSN-46.1]
MVAGRRIRFAAVLAVVVLALTGFSSSGGHGSNGSGSGSGKSGKSKSSGGGGCSSSKSKSSKSSKKKSSNSHSGGNATASPTSTPTETTPPAHAEVVTCAGPGRAKATLKVTSDVAGDRTFRVPLVFEGATGRVDSTSVEVVLKARESRTVEVPMLLADQAGDVRSCVVGRIQTVSAAASRPTSTASTSVGIPKGGSTRTPAAKPKPKRTR